MRSETPRDVLTGGGVRVTWVGGWEERWVVGGRKRVRGYRNCGDDITGTGSHLGFSGCITGKSNFRLQKFFLF